MDGWLDEYSEDVFPLLEDAPGSRRDGGSSKLVEEVPLVDSKWCWAEQQVEDCSAPAIFSFEERGALEAGAPFNLYEPPFEELVSLEDFFGTPELHEELMPDSPPRSCAFKESYAHRSPSPPLTPQTKRCLPTQTISPEASSNSDSSSSSPGIQVVKGCQGEDVCLEASHEEGTQSLYAIDPQGSGSSRSSSSMCVRASMEGEFGSLDSEMQSSELIQDSNKAMDLLEMDLQCEGEQLSLECDEDLGGAPSLSTGVDWLSVPCTAQKRLDFIPVCNDCPLSDYEPSYKVKGVSSDESDNDSGCEDALTLRRRTARRALSLAHAQSSSSPGPSLPPPAPAPVASQGSAKQPEKEEETPRQIVAVASAASITTPPKPAAVRKRRAGRPSRPTTAAKEAKAAGGVKRKRPTTSKPAVPPVAGQACTQCSTHHTPVWRAGPEGPKTLCNACGVRYMKVAKKK